MYLLWRSGENDTAMKKYMSVESLRPTSTLDVHAEGEQTVQLLQRLIDVLYVKLMVLLHPPFPVYKNKVFSLSSAYSSRRSVILEYTLPFHCYVLTKL